MFIAVGGVIAAAVATIVILAATRVGTKTAAAPAAIPDGAVVAQPPAIDAAVIATTPDAAPALPPDAEVASVPVDAAVEQTTRVDLPKDAKDAKDTKRPRVPKDKKPKETGKTSGGDDDVLNMRQ